MMQVKEELIGKLKYSLQDENLYFSPPECLLDSLKLISNFFKSYTNNKLCLVFPIKEHVAQWLTIPIIFSLIDNDYGLFKDELSQTYQQFKPQDKLILNNKAIVEWVGIKEISINGEKFNRPTFKTKNNREVSEVSLKFSDILKLQRAPLNRQILSSLNIVMKALPLNQKTALEKLLGIDSFGNKEFIKNSIVLISTFKSYDDSIMNLLINETEISDYYIYGKIDENGNSNEYSPFMISNNFSNLLFYLAQSSLVSKIIIDGFNSVTPRGDFSDVDREFKIPTILITDLSEIESFSEIKNHGFDFFNFTKKNITIKVNRNSPFETFEQKLSKYVAFKFEREVCTNSTLESIAQKLHSLPKDDSDENLNLLRISLIQLTNLLSRICYVPNENEVSNLNQKISNIESHFLNCQLWLGEAKQVVEDAIILLKCFVQYLSENKTEKCILLEELLKEKYDYIICPTEQEAETLSQHIKDSVMKIISVADVNDHILSGGSVKAILTGWAKSNNISRILSSFLFSELTVLFYHFENCYYNSLQRRNRKNNKNIQQTVTKEGIATKAEDSKQSGFEDLYSEDESIESTAEFQFDIVDFELKIDNAQYSKYSGKGNIAESCKAKRIDFENDAFIYATESHKFLVINELIDSAKSNPNIYNKKFESLQRGDVIAFINTDRDVLVELVEKTTKPDELAEIKKWTELWKSLLRNYFESIGNDFKKLVEDLRKYDCKKHPYTIKNWMQDDSLIGPDSDDDLRSIGMLAESELLFENIEIVREAISQMTKWRMRAADIVRDKIKNKLIEVANHSIVNSPIEIQDLGRVEILKVNDLKRESEEIDKKFVHRLIAKEII